MSKLVLLLVLFGLAAVLSFRNFLVGAQRNPSVYLVV